MPRPRILIPRRWPRETRLLVVTIVLWLAVLLTLARFRFPAEQPLTLPVQPLQQLAARAAFDDLSASVTRAATQVRPSLWSSPVHQLWRSCAASRSKTCFATMGPMLLPITCWPCGFGQPSPSSCRPAGRSRYGRPTHGSWSTAARRSQGAHNHPCAAALR